MTWVDSHCHLAVAGTDEDPTTALAGRGGRASERAGLRGHRPRDVPSGGRGGRGATRRGLGPPSACIPTTPPAWTRVGRPRRAGARHPTVVADRRGRLRPLLRALGAPTSRRSRSARRCSSRTSSTVALVIHSRDAWDDTFAVLADVGARRRTVFHCFTGGPDEARRALDLGAYLSFSGIVSFKNADDVRAAAALAPLDRVLVETDAPFLAPVPHRGQQNEPRVGGRRRRRPRGRDGPSGRGGRRRRPPEHRRRVRTRHAAAHASDLGDPPPPAWSMPSGWG